MLVRKGHHSIGSGRSASNPHHIQPSHLRAAFLGIQHDTTTGTATCRPGDSLQLPLCSYNAGFWVVSAVFTRGTHTSPSDAEVMRSMLGSMGTCDEIPEHHMDAACGVACSGPAFARFEACSARLDSLICPDAGSRPKYLTLISWPTSRPRALGWCTCGGGSAE
ncbi:Pyrroline-5-carboxylate reductase 1, mitochondrial [Portunus trituberculatus]|uniref:Pyrroline-5-carboxylate reductase 1, mitochondrial n=1 Tax=Portunus trituberculatus TaxID=210409 RepID=A0A5B7DKM1_PORTR|nr:Pyrroline-5-carboxylate reductase 1, mitochondrial [Portunus trituberculatus]